MYIFDPLVNTCKDVEDAALPTKMTVTRLNSELKFMKFSLILNVESCT